MKHMTSIRFALLAVLVSGGCSSDPASPPPPKFDTSVPMDSLLALDSASPLDSGVADGPSIDLAGHEAGGADQAADVSTEDAPTTDAPVGYADAPAEDGGEEPDTSVDAVAMCGRLLCDCTFNGKNLFGGVRYVERVMPHDVKVRVVTNQLADLFVQEVTGAGLANRCGQWKTDHPLPQLRVVKVDPPELADFSIQYDMLRPGLPGRR